MRSYINMFLMVIPFNFLQNINKPTKIQNLDFRGFHGGGEPYTISVTIDISKYRHKTNCERNWYYESKYNRAIQSIKIYKDGNVVYN